MDFLSPVACLVGLGQGFQVSSANRSRHVGFNCVYQQVSELRLNMS